MSILLVFCFYFWSLIILCALLLLTLPLWSLWLVLTLSLCPKMLLLSEMCQPYLNACEVTQAYVTTITYVFILLKVRVILCCCICFVINWKRSTIILSKKHFCRIIHAFLDFFSFFYEKWHIAFIVHNAWRRRLSSGKRIMFNFFAGVLYKLNNRYCYK